MIRYKLFLIIFIISTNLFSYNDKSVVVEIGKEKVTIDELKKAYEKNLTNKQDGLLSLNKNEFNNFLSLYIDYKLKVLDAIDKGYLNEPSVIEEVKTNRDLIAKSFFLDKKFESPKVDEILQKRLKEFRFAYIIIPFANDSIAGESKAKAYNALEKIQNGEDFAQVAKVYSKDLKTAEKGGEVDSWVTGGQLQKHLEIPLLSLKPGQYFNKVIETNYGYFIVKLLEIEDRYYHKGGHILLQFKGETKEDSTDVYEKMRTIQLELKKGIPFEDLAKKYSEDLSTKDSGGVFSYWYNRATGFENNGSPLVKPFEKAFIPLKENEVSDVVTTEYGIHLIKKYGIKKIDLSEEIKKVKELYKKVYYSNELKLFTDSLAKSYGYILFDNIRDDFQKYLDTTKTNLGDTWADSVPQDFYHKKLFSFNKKFYSVEDFINQSNSKRELKGFVLSDEGIELATKKMIDKELFEVATQNLENEYDEFNRLAEEFKNGTILFKAEDVEVWKKNKLDSNIAKAYYDSTKSNYMTNWQYELYEIFQFSEKNINSTLKKLENGEDFETLALVETQREGFREKKGYRGIIDAGKDKLAQLIDPNKIELNKIYGPIELDRGFSIVKCVNKTAPRVMTFEEAFPLISPRVLEISQNNLKKEWLEKVKQKHKVIINQKLVNEIYK